MFVEEWCYGKTEDLQKNEHVVFLNDNGNTHPAVMGLVSVNGNKSYITHGSLLKGKLTYHRTQYDNLSPIGGPIFEMDAASKTYRATRTRTASEFVQLSDQVLKLKQFVGATNLYVVEEGQFEEMLSDEKLPWRGYWWPHSGLPLSGADDSPLAKYDNLVQARTGRNPGAREWENTYHSLEHVPWGGHCNGWAASSVLYEDITTEKYDPLTDTTLSVGDLKGMLAEASFCVKWAFYGSRYNGGPNEDITDIHAHRFHKVLLYYIKHLRKPIAHDYVQGSSVDNNIYSGYRFNIEKVDDTPGRFRVLARMRTHGYGHGFDDHGPSSQFTSEYEYYLDTNPSGEIVGGEWISTNPDFLWVPLYQQKCGRENPGIDHRFVEQFIQLSPRTGLLPTF